MGKSPLKAASAHAAAGVGFDLDSSRSLCSESDVHQVSSTINTLTVDKEVSVFSEANPFSEDLMRMQSHREQVNATDKLAQVQPAVDPTKELSHLLAQKALESSQMLGHLALVHGRDASIFLATGAQELAVQSWPHIAGAASGAWDLTADAAKVATVFAGVATRHAADKFAGCINGSGDGEASEEEEEEDTSHGGQSKPIQLPPHVQDVRQVPPLPRMSSWASSQPRSFYQPQAAGTGCQSSASPAMHGRLVAMAMARDTSTFSASSTPHASHMACSPASSQANAATLCHPLPRPASSVQLSGSFSNSLRVERLGVPRTSGSFSNSLHAPRLELPRSSGSFSNSLHAPRSQVPKSSDIFSTSLHAPGSQVPKIALPPVPRLQLPRAGCSSIVA